MEIYERVFGMLHNKPHLIKFSNILSTADLCKTKVRMVDEAPRWVSVVEQAPHLLVNAALRLLQQIRSLKWSYKPSFFFQNTIKHTIQGEGIRQWFLRINIIQRHTWQSVYWSLTLKTYSKLESAMTPRVNPSEMAFGKSVSASMGFSKAGTASTAVRVPEYKAAGKSYDEDDTMQFRVRFMWSRIVTRGLLKLPYT